MAAFTELESTVLGLIQQHGPCTSYEIMRLFQQSPTASWRASSGSIYPLVRKLIGLGLVEAQPSAAGGRKSNLLTLSSSGRAALVDWLREMPDGLGDPSPDPIRTRLLFIGDLPPAQRRAFVERSVALTENSIGSLQAVIASIPADEPYEYFVHAGALHELQARRDWLRGVLAALPREKRKR
jgi:DNA-binding PadR family transcriptional regulator